MRFVCPSCPAWCPIDLLLAPARGLDIAPPVNGVCLRVIRLPCFTCLHHLSMPCRRSLRRMRGGRTTRGILHVDPKHAEQPALRRATGHEVCNHRQMTTLHGTQIRTFGPGFRHALWEQQTWRQEQGVAPTPTHTHAQARTSRSRDLSGEMDGCLMLPRISYPHPQQDQPGTDTPGRNM